MIYHLISLTLAYGLDLWLGDPRWLPHPVVGMGRLITYFERKLNRGKNRRLRGAMMIFIVLIIVGGIAVIIVDLAYANHLWTGVILETLLIWTTIAQKGLQQASEQVAIPLVEGNLEKAREKLSAIVGRDTENLNDAQVIRGTVETVAENISDGITAPLFFAFIGGAPLAIIYRAINTCDSMVGYKNSQYEAFGWASARLDDLINWFPSRLTGWVIVAMNAGKPSRLTVVRQLPEQAGQHPSPNSGWGEAAVALLLGVQLGGVNYYFGDRSERPTIGYPDHSFCIPHITDTVRIMRRACLGFIIFLWIGGVTFDLASPWSKLF